MHHRCILLVALLLVQLALAGTTGKLAGKVTRKETGEPLIGANVMIDGTPLGVATDLDGNYYILQIMPGSYSIRFSMIGYQTLVINDVRIKVDLTTTIDGALTESAIGLEEVVVQAERAMIQPDVTYSQANISGDEVDMLPVEEFEDVLALQAGVVSMGGEIHVRGGRGGEISYMIDGITVTDPYNANIGVEIENNSIQELQFISGTFNAEYGQAMSGIVNIITKDGDYSRFSGNVSVNRGSYYSNGDMMDVTTVSSDPRLDTPELWIAHHEEQAIKMKLFPQIGSFDLDHISDLKANIGGPIIPGMISFFASGRIKKDNGYLYGQRIFHPNSFVWVDTLGNWHLDSSVVDPLNPNHGSLGNGYVPTEDDSLILIIDSLRNADAFDWVPMNWYEQVTGQAKLSWRVTPYIKLSYNLMLSDTKSQDYTHSYKWNPDGRSYSFNTRTGNIFRMDFSLNQATYANVMYALVENHYRSHLSPDESFFTEIKNTYDENGYSNDNLSDTLYFVEPTNIFDYAAGQNFYVGGQSMDVYSRKSIVNTYKAELTSQLNAKHQVKGGLEYRKTKITLNDLTVLYSSYTDYEPVYRDPNSSPTHDSFGDGRNPIEFSGYLQDKFESDDMVVNIGLRYDHFNSQWKVLNDSEDPNYLYPLKPINRWFDLDGDGRISDEEMTDNNRKTDADRLTSNAYGESWFRSVDPKTQLSPRFALAFPITDKGYMHFSYGHFFQNPSFNYIYDNPEFEVPAASGISSTMGNANMEPQRTTQYEVGFSQQIGRDIGIEITGYFKDIRNLNSSAIKKTFIAGDRYGLYVNKDHANSRGITIALSKRSLQNFSGNLDYTYSVSEGNASDPTAAFFDEQSNIEPEKMLVPLDWDQRHTINGTMTYHPTKYSGVSCVFNYGSGFPYTTQFFDEGPRAAFENNALKPPTYNMDLRSYYNFSLTKSIQVSAHINIYNLFDVRNELTVYDDTGRATYSLLPTYTPQFSGPQLNSLDQYLVQPSYYSMPRQIKVGVSVSLK
ncbi:MAG: TonB-dependent receptor [Candidatus Neomarinimicrobiota bacterium]|nr:TonB-dependent receptor [Candidatus Neomarinimicrobiota bacterium]